MQQLSNFLCGIRFASLLGIRFIWSCIREANQFAEEELSSFLCFYSGYYYILYLELMRLGHKISVITFIRNRAHSFLHRVFAVKNSLIFSAEVKILQRVNYVNLVKSVFFQHSVMGTAFWFVSMLNMAYQTNDYSPRHYLLQALGSPHLDDVANVAYAFMVNIRDQEWLMVIYRPSCIVFNSSFQARIWNFSTAGPARSSVPEADVFFFFWLLPLRVLSGREGIEDSKSAEIVWKDTREILEIGKNIEERLARWMDSSLLKSLLPYRWISKLGKLSCILHGNIYSRSARLSNDKDSLQPFIVLTPQMNERSWISEREPDASLQVISPVIDRQVYFISLHVVL